LRSSLIAPRQTPSFVTAIWFPKNAKGECHNDGIHLSSDHTSQVLVELNNSQREIVGAMLSLAPQDSLAIAHGIIIPLKLLAIHADADVIAQGLLEQGRQQRLPQQQQYGCPVDCRAG
jgi:hypothetical protein